MLMGLTFGSWGPGSWIEWIKGGTAKAVRENDYVECHVCKLGTVWNRLVKEYEGCQRIG